MTGPQTPRQVLLACYFPRSVAIEGVGTLVSGLAEGMILAGWQVCLLVPEGPLDLHPAVRVVTYRPGGLRGWRRYRRAVAQLSETAETVLLVENNPNMVGVADASRCRGDTFCLFYSPLQTLAVLRELGLCRQALLHALGKSPWLCRWRRWPDRRCIVASEYQARQMRALGVEHVYVLPVCSVSRSSAMPTRAAARQELGWNDRPVVGYLGHFSRAKGVNTLVDAFLQYTGPAVLALAHSGKGRLGGRASSNMRTMQETDRLRMMGMVDPCVFLAACDVVALPYRTGSVFHQPQVMLESFAAGTAVITTDVAGCGELVGRMRAGEVVPPRDPSGLAAAIGRRIENLPETHEMGRDGRRLFERRLCREVFLQEFGRLLEGRRVDPAIGREDLGSGCAKPDALRPLTPVHPASI